MQIVDLSYPQILESSSEKRVELECRDALPSSAVTTLYSLAQQTRTSRFTLPVR